MLKGTGKAVRRGSTKNRVNRATSKLAFGDQTSLDMTNEPPLSTSSQRGDLHLQGSVVSLASLWNESMPVLSVTLLKAVWTSVCNARVYCSCTFHQQTLISPDAQNFSIVRELYPSRPSPSLAIKAKLEISL